jgi:hypothetical protein
MVVKTTRGDIIKYIEDKERIKWEFRVVDLV